MSENTTSKTIFVTDFLGKFNIYVDPDRVHNLIGNDVLNLTNSDNELDLYIQLNDLVDGGNIYHHILEIDHPIFLDIGRFYDTTEGKKFFRDFSLIEDIEIQMHFNTKPILVSILDNFADMYLIQTYLFWNNFSLTLNHWCKYGKKKNPLMATLSLAKLDYFFVDSMWYTGAIDPAYNVNFLEYVLESRGDVDSLPFHNSAEFVLPAKVYRNPVLYVKGVGDSDTRIFIVMDRLSENYKYSSDNFFFWLFKKDNSVKDTLRDRYVVYGLNNRLLYLDGIFGVKELHMPGDIRPTLYSYLETFADSEKEKRNSTYYFAQIKQELIMRWILYTRSSLGAFKIPPARSFAGEYNIYTKLYAMAVVETKERYDYLKTVITTDYPGKTIYYIFEFTDEMKKRYDFNTAAVLEAATHGDGRVDLGDRKKIVFDRGVGTENLLNVSLNFYLKFFGLNYTYFMEALGHATSAKSLEILEKTMDDASIEPRVITEFYDREHPCPFDDVYSYVPIPLTFANYDGSEAYLSGLKNPAYNEVGYVIEKRKYEEDEDGNVIIKDAGTLVMSPSSFKIPLNKNEYVYKAYVKRYAKMWFSKDMYIHIKIKFKKTSQYHQNFVLRLMTSDLTIAREIFVKRGKEDV